MKDVEAYSGTDGPGRSQLCPSRLGGGNAAGRWGADF
jgi:hypothetical protein